MHTFLQAGAWQRDKQTPTGIKQQFKDAFDRTDFLKKLLTNCKVFNKKLKKEKKMSVKNVQIVRLIHATKAPDPESLAQPRSE